MQMSIHTSTHNTALTPAFLSSKASCIPLSSAMDQQCLSAADMDVFEHLSPYSVIIGRSKACRDSVGNRRLKVLATMFLPRYTQAKGRREKSNIVSALMDMVHEAGGSFVKLVEGEWSVADNHAAREKVGVVLRDLLHDRYRSSTKSKVVARRQRLSQEQDDNYMALPDIAISRVWFSVDDKTLDIALKELW